MKIVINVCYGGFSIKDEIVSEYGFKKYTTPRDDEKLIILIESGIDCNDDCSKLKVVDIPDNATDYYINEYDGLEDVLYVIDGKIYSYEGW